MLNSAIIICAGLVSVLETKISLTDVINRAQYWSNSGVRYNKSAYHPDQDGKSYRTDCSGYVSMAWKLPSSMTTRTLIQILKPIRKDELASGDIILRSGRHVVIFDKWASEERERYWAYEQKPPKAVYREIKYPYDKKGLSLSSIRRLYLPFRYRNIV